MGVLLFVKDFWCHQKWGSTACRRRLISLQFASEAKIRNLARNFDVFLCKVKTPHKLFEFFRRHWVIRHMIEVKHNVWQFEISVHHVVRLNCCQALYDLTHQDPCLHLR